MPEQQFTDFITELTQRTAAAATFLRNQKDGNFLFDGGKISAYQDIYDLCSRDDIIAKLKSLSQGKQVSPGDWVPLKLQADYLARAERDLRLRFRSRLDSYRLASSGQVFIGVVLKDIANQIASMSPTAANASATP